MNRRRGFTLIELSVVLTMIVLFTAVAVVSLREPYQRIRFRNAIEQIDFRQTMQRKECRRMRHPQVLVMDFDAQELRAGDTGRPDQLLRFQDGIAIDQLIVAGRTVSHGKLAFMIGTDGQCHTFAVHLSGPFGQTRWLLFAGTTGQLTELESEEPVYGAFNLLSP